VDFSEDSSYQRGLCKTKPDRAGFFVILNRHRRPSISPFPVQARDPSSEAHVDLQSRLEAQYAQPQLGQTNPTLTRYPHLLKPTRQEDDYRLEPAAVGQDGRQMGAEKKKGYGLKP
jgi:hypothetical protein